MHSLTADISGLFEDLNRVFDNEMEKHVEALSAVEKSIRVATRSLAERRQQVDAARQKLATLEQQAERAANARRALDAPDLDWTGRTPLKGETSLPPAFGVDIPLLPAAPGGKDEAMDVDKDDKEGDKDKDIPVPEKGAEGALVTLRRIAAWEERVARLLEERAAELEGDGADRAIKYRKVIALCAKVSVDQVDDVSTEPGRQPWRLLERYWRWHRVAARRARRVKVGTAECVAQEAAQVTSCYEDATCPSECRGVRRPMCGLRVGWPFAVWLALWIAVT